ncbi:hypothetical protein [Aquibium microcysteis]|uniref:hypothetical protein n=1 Tax=Aquibium microcysteis TaxID=675281 RepID=UPI00165D12E9|nr:hypothetical protein [Aquibium microcysteis]
MKNVTVSMDEAILAEARVKAARAGKSLSKYMAGLVEADVGSVRLPGTAATREEQIAALDAMLKGPKWAIMRDGRMPTSDERNER